MKRVSKLHFAMVIVLPLLFACGLAWQQTSNLIEELVEISERESMLRSEKLAVSGFKAYRQQLEKYAIDSANWDDAVTNITGTPNLDWIVSAWATAVDETDGIYNIFMVVDGVTSKVVLALDDGAVADLKVTDVFGSNWQNVLARLPGDPNTPGSTSVYVRTSKGIAVAAISPVVPVDEELATKSSRPHYLVFLRNVDKAVLTQLGEQYAFRDLELSENAVAGRGNIKVLDDVGIVSPVASWTTNNQDILKRWELWNRAITTLVVMLLVLVVMAAAYWRLLRRVRQSEQNATHAAHHDQLTGLGNRAAFHQRIQTLVATDKCQGSLAFADLDGFKAVNDNFGHGAGDTLLSKVADMISNLEVASENAFRLGGDEFVVLFTGDNHAMQANDFAARLITALRKPFDLGGHVATIGVSIGIAHAEPDCLDADTLVRHADEAMYLAKKAGRNCFANYGEIQMQTVENLKLLRQIANANQSDKGEYERRSFRA